MKKIKLSQGKVALVDDDDYERLSKYTWYACAKNTDHLTVKWYARRYEGPVCIYMHREIMNTPRGLVVDHSPDPSGLNNQKSNLTNVTDERNTRHCRFKRTKKRQEEPCL